jgi:hypothetical protein
MGIGHYGCFAADYRRRFRCKPSETLRAKGIELGCRALRMSFPGGSPTQEAERRRNQSK